jgi:feruloyl esterase
VFNDSRWDWWKFNWGSDIDVIDRTVGSVFNATSTDLSRFRSHHGKLIMFMGWQDPVGAAGEAIAYYQGVEANASGASQVERRRQTQAFLRLYMVPGMAHCAGGPGATHFSTATRDSDPPVSDAQRDMALALQDWVERGVAPESLIATKFDNANGTERRAVFQRPLCVYPNVARYKGGPTTSAESFACVAPGSAPRGWAARPPRDATARMSIDTRLGGEIARQGCTFQSCEYAQHEHRPNPARDCQTAKILRCEPTAGRAGWTHSTGVE